MSDNNRPSEIHIKSISAVERDQLPLLSSMVYGELYAAEMLNMRGLGVTSPGIFTGFEPSIKSGLTLSIKRDQSEGFGAALCQVGLQQFHIIQQHDMEITLPTGYHWYVVLEAFYQPNTLTTQVDIDATDDAACIKHVLLGDLKSHHQVICEVNLTHGGLSIRPSDIILDKRVDQTFTINQHVQESDPHPQYALKQGIDQLVKDTIANGLSQNPAGFDPNLPISENAVRVGLSKKAAVQHSHTGEEISKATLIDFGVVKISNAINSDDATTVATSKALKDGLKGKADDDHSHDANSLPAASTTDLGLVRLSNSYTSLATDAAATPKAVSDGLKQKADKNHTHEAGELPDANTTAKGIVLLSNQHDADAEDTVPTSNALSNGLKLKADAAKLIESNANVTLTRQGGSTTLLRTDAGNAAITIDVSTFQTADEIHLIAANNATGTITITNNGGKIYDADNESDSSITMTGKGRISFIKVAEENALRIIP